MVGCSRAVQLALVAIGWGAAVAAGPASAADGGAAAASACMASAPAGLETYWRAVCTSDPKDVVLRRLQAGQAAFAAGRRRAAEREFDEATRAIETVYAQTGAAEKARSAWSADGAEDFKGEPYERVMAYYYRGLLALMAGDWTRAQVSFKGGILQDTFDGLKRNRPDVASLSWLEGWAQRCGGADGPAAALFAEAASLRSGLQPPAADATVLIIAESGAGPRKAAVGKHGERLVYSDGMVGNDRLIAVVGDRRAEMVEAENLYILATSRGGRQMDELLAQRAETKDVTLGAGQAAAAVGVGTAAGMASLHASGYTTRATQTAGAVGGIVGVIGLIAMATSDAMNVTADTRAWESLPHSLYFATTAPPPDGVRAEAVTLLDGAEHKVLADPARLQVASHLKCTLVWAGSGAILPSREPAAGTVPDAAAMPAGEPTCRTPSGAGAVLPPDVCLRIGGKPLP
jgi:hypothetical protein